MKIVVASDVMQPGGVDEYVRAVVRSLRAAGDQPELVVESRSASRLAAVAEEERVPLHAIRLHHRSHRDADVDADCREVLSRVAPAGLHVVCGIPWSCLALRRVAAERGVPLQLTEQYVPDDLVLGEEQRAAVLASYRGARRVIFVSRGNRRRMGGLVDLSGVRHEVIPNGVEVSAIERRSPTLEARGERFSSRAREGGIELTTAARLTPEKGLEVLVDAVALVPRGVVARVDVVGDGPGRAELERRASAAGVDAVVRFHRWSSDVVGEMARHDVLVLPSRHEGMPFVLLEAMAAGIPSIATDTPGAVEALDGGRAGTLVPRDDPPALARAIEAAARDVPGALARAAVARERARAEYDRDALMARTVALWRS